MQHVLTCCGCHPSSHSAASTSVSQLCSHNRNGNVLQEPDAGSQAADASRMRDVMSRCGALGSERPRASFKTNNLEQDLTRLLKSGNVEQHRDVLERKLASSALAGGHFKCWLVLQFFSHQQYFIAILSMAMVIGVPISHAFRQKSNAALWTGV